MSHPKPIALLVLCTLLAAAAGPARGADDMPTLSIGYVDSIVYRGERLTLTAHIGNPSSHSREVTVRVTVQQRDRSEPPVETTLVVNPGGTAYQDLTVPLPDARGGLLRGLVALLEGDRPIGSAEIVVTAPTADLPKLRVDGATLLDDTGRPVVVQIEQRRWIEDRSWILLKKLSETTTRQKCKPAEAIVIADVLEAADRNEGYWRLLKDHVAGQGVRLVGWSRPERGLETPALGVLAAFTQIDLTAPVKAAVIFVGSADRLTASEPRLVTMALETIVQRLEAAGCGEVAFLLPIAPPPLRDEQRPYVMAVLEVARAYKAATLNLPGKLGDACWRSGGGAGAEVYRSQPDAAGQRLIFEALLDALKAMAVVK